MCACVFVCVRECVFRRNKYSREYYQQIVTITIIGYGVPCNYHMFHIHLRSKKCCSGDLLCNISTRISIRLGDNIFLWCAVIWCSVRLPQGTFPSYLMFCPFVNVYTSSCVWSSRVKMSTITWNIERVLFAPFLILIMFMFHIVLDAWYLILHSSLTFNVLHTAYHYTYFMLCTGDYVGNKWQLSPS